MKAREYTSVYVDGTLVARYSRPKDAEREAMRLRATGKDARVLRELVMLVGQYHMPTNRNVPVIAGCLQKQADWNKER